MAQTLNRRLRVVLATAKRTDNKQRALAKAEAILNDYFDKIVKYTFQSRVKQMIKNPRQLTENEYELLRKKTVEPKLTEFRAILEDL